MISVVAKQNKIELLIKAQLINDSNTIFNLEKLKDVIVEQSNAVYKQQIGKYDLNLKLDVQIIKYKWQCSPKKILFQIVNSVASNNPAEADFKGLRVKLNKTVIADIIQGKNRRTIPHEIGHLLGWDHPHARAKYESVNENAHPFEKELSESERKSNLMSQTWYIQKAGTEIDAAMQLTEKQIELVLLHVKENTLNKNFHLRHFLFWKQIV